MAEGERPSLLLSESRSALISEFIDEEVLNSSGGGVPEESHDASSFDRAETSDETTQPRSSSAEADKDKIYSNEVSKPYVEVIAESPHKVNKRNFGHKRYQSDGVVLKSRRPNNSLSIFSSNHSRDPSFTKRKRSSIASKIELGDMTAKELPPRLNTGPKSPRLLSVLTPTSPTIKAAQEFVMERIVLPWYRRLLIILEAIIVPIDPPPPYHQRPPIFPKINQFIIKHTPTSRKIRTAFCIFWVVIFILMVYFNSYADNTDVGRPLSVECFANFWGPGCGVAGQNCLPFANKTTYIRCFNDCDQTRTKADSLIGQKVLPSGEPYVIGSPQGYRADSWVCPSAIQSGAISPRWGGCIAVDFIGEMKSYSSSLINGIAGWSFDSTFPKSYTIRPVDARFCNDYSWFMLPVNFIMAIIYAFLQPTKASWWMTMTVMGFYYVLFFSDPADHGDAYISGSFGGIFVVVAMSLCLFRMGGKTVVPPGNHPTDRIFLFIAPFFFGMLINKWSAPLPVAISDLTLTPDAFQSRTQTLAIIGGGCVLFALIAYQLFHIRRLKLLPYYLLGYVVFVLCYSLLPLLLVLEVHLHHWLLPIVLWPLTTVKIRVSVVYQACLLGLFLNGATRWGIASPLETYIVSPSSSYGSPVMSWTFNATQISNDFMLRWRFIPSKNMDIGWVPHTPQGQSLLQDGIGDITSIQPGMWIHGYSLVMNDVEIYRGQKASFDVSSILNQTDVPNDRPYYFRVAATSEGNTLEYTYPLAVYKNGSARWYDGSWYTGYRSIDLTASYTYHGHD